MKTVAVIGKNFGDEGKGLVTAGLCSCAPQPLIVRHNGGAQAGHTVESTETGMRFVHHQIGSGAEYGASTLLAETFHPDLYQLGKETAAFQETFGFLPVLFAEPEAAVTVIDDVLVNMALETERGAGRHGSCGMGIQACCDRNAAGCGLTVKEIAGSTGEQIAGRLRQIRKEYVLPAVRSLNIRETNPYLDMLRDDTVLVNYAEEICAASRLLTVTGAGADWLAQFDSLIFETGQGLLLDQDYLEYAPHLTASKTGVAESLRFLAKRGMTLDEAVYVTRPYVTRHGAGPLPLACARKHLPGVKQDRTNVANPWQGRLRYARHDNPDSFLQPLLRDVSVAGLRPSLAVTHLDETGRRMFFRDQDMDWEEFISRISPEFERIYISEDRQHIRECGGHE